MKSLMCITAFLLLFTLQLSAQTKMIINKSNGTSVDVNIADIKSIYFSTNLIKNYDFSDSFDNWLLIGDTTNPYHPSDPGRADFEINDGVASINITNQGLDLWSVMLYQRVNFEKDATYYISFDAKSDTPFEIISNVCEEDGAWTNYSGNKKFTLTSIMTTYSFEFTMKVSGKALFQFYLGKMGTGKLYLDNIVLRKK